MQKWSRPLTHIPDAWQCLASSDLSVKHVLQVMSTSLIVGVHEMKPGSVKVIEKPAVMKLIQSAKDHTLEAKLGSGVNLYRSKHSQL